MIRKKILVLGGPGDGLVVAEAILQCERAEQPVSFGGYLNDALPAGTELHGGSVLGRLEDWRKFASTHHFCPALQKLKHMQSRAHRIDDLGIPEALWQTVIHPKAAVSTGASIKPGVFIASCATVQPECSIESFASLRAGAMLGHHCHVGPHAYIGPNAVMCGWAKLEIGAHLGPGAVLLDSIAMGPFAIAGIGAAVTKTVAEREIVFGNPAKRVGFVPLATEA